MPIMLLIGDDLANLDIAELRTKYNEPTAEIVHVTNDALERFVNACLNHITVHEEEFDEGRIVTAIRGIFADVTGMRSAGQNLAAVEQIVLTTDTEHRLRKTILQPQTNKMSVVDRLYDIGYNAIIRIRPVNKV